VVDFARDQALAMPQGMGLAETWRWLAALGRHDLVAARFAEGHADAVAILGQAGREPMTGAFYGVWASASGGTGLTAEPGAQHWRLSGTMRFCTGAGSLDRALVTAATADGRLLLFDIGVRGQGWRPIEGSWPAVGMDLSQSLDVEVDVVVPDSALIGGDGFYLARPGFALGGIGVAAVWLGGAAGVLDTVTDGLRRLTPTPHQLAHLGTMATAVLAADDVLTRIAQSCSGPLDHLVKAPAAESLSAISLRARSTVEEAVRVVLDRAPRLTGPGPLCRDAQFAHRISDLLVYVRQHHAERDLEELGAAQLAAGDFGSGATGSGA
jgi:alkylation response protein AidB-like acyl-CoA dehydrogenase